MKRLDFIGNIGRTAERMTTANGRELMRFSVAVNDKDGGTLWVSVIMNYREGVFPYLVQGKQVFVSGDFRVSEYKGTFAVDSFADRVELLGTKKEDTAQQVANGVYTPNQPTGTQAEEMNGKDNGNVL